MSRCGFRFSPRMFTDLSNAERLRAILGDVGTLIGELLLVAAVIFMARWIVTRKK